MPQNNKVTLVIIGGTGDLTKRKLVPALASLIKQEHLHADALIVGVSRKEFSDIEYKNHLLESTSDEETKSQVRRVRVAYLKADIGDSDTFPHLVQKLSELEKGKNHQRIFYLATSYNLFPSIVNSLKQHGLNKNSSGVKIAFEKPFGHSKSSAAELDRNLHEVFSEEEIFRIDHYLAKESVQNIISLRFSNPIIEQLLQRQFIERIELVIDEYMGVEGRFNYYESAGALKDMVQNHLLQVTSIFLMEKPRTLHSNSIHEAKLSALKNLRVQPASEHLLGQYESYESEAKSSSTIVSKKTETFAKISLQSEHARWKGIPITLRTGKKLTTKIGQLRVIFKEPYPGLSSAFTGLKKNALLIDLFPKQDVKLILNSRKPNTSQDVEPVVLEFCHDCHFGPNTVDEYSTLLKEVIAGDQTIFSRSDEIIESWRIIEDIESMKADIPFINYKDHSDPEKK